MKWAPTSASLTVALMMCGVAASGLAQATPSFQPIRGTVRVDRTALPYELTIEPSKMQADSTSIETGAETWIARGYGLKTLIAQIFDIDIRRIDFPDGGMADARYDVSLSLPKEVGEDVMQRLLADGLQKKFGLKIAPESRTLDVYVMSAPDGPKAELHTHVFTHRSRGGVTAVSQDSSSQASEGEGRITYIGKQCSGVSSGGISVSAGTMADFRRTLEPDLDRVLLDETNLAGSYDFKIGNYTNRDELFKLLQDQLGLVVTPSQRQVTVLTVRPVQSLQAAM